MRGKNIVTVSTNQNGDCAEPLPEYLRVAPEELGAGGPVKVLIVPDATAIAEHMAESICDDIAGAAARGRSATLIVPVGPIDQFPILASMINEREIDCRETMFINMDEYLDERGDWVSAAHPLSFRGFMERRFYGLLDPALAPAPAYRVFPNPHRPEEIGDLISERGGVDVCYGGIGINGHLAFNEPPLGPVPVDEFARYPTRVLPLAAETRTINSVTVGGEISIIPKSAVTIGMREILSSRKLRFYCNRPWQSGVVRRVLHGPISPDCPASYLRTHSDAMLIMAEYVAARPAIQLR